MAFPKPVKGLVIRYAFLWSTDRDVGREEASKDRPCAIVLSIVDKETGDTKVTVAPITHTPPRSDQRSLELTEAETKAIGLDDDRHWVVLEELNRFTWPGYDIRPIPGTRRHDYGRLPESTYKRIVMEILRLDRARKTAGGVGVHPIPRD